MSNIKNLNLPVVENTTKETPRDFEEILDLKNMQDQLKINTNIQKTILKKLEQENDHYSKLEKILGDVKNAVKLTKNPSYTKELESLGQIKSQISRLQSEVKKIGSNIDTINVSKDNNKKQDEKKNKQMKKEEKQKNKQMKKEEKQKNKQMKKEEKQKNKQMKKEEKQKNKQMKKEEKQKNKQMKKEEKQKNKQMKK